MIYHTVVRLVIGSDSFGASQSTFSITMKMCGHSAHAGGKGSSTIVFPTATVGAIGLNSCGLVNTAATVLMFVAMLATFAGAREPFETKLIFCDFHDVNPGAGGETRTHGGFPTAYKTVAIAAMRLQQIWRCD
jgi:hypothetical protein